MKQIKDLLQDDYLETRIKGQTILQITRPDAERLKFYRVKAIIRKIKDRWFVTY